MLGFCCGCSDELSSLLNAFMYGMHNNYLISSGVFGDYNYSHAKISSTLLYQFNRVSYNWLVSIICQHNTWVRTLLSEMRIMMDPLYRCGCSLILTSDQTMSAKCMPTHRLLCTLFLCSYCKVTYIPLYCDGPN